jgi:3-oxoacyl-[acyl-carrier protein] reductase
MEMELAGRRAIITGANRGLGAGIARAFVAAGASVLLTARDETLLHGVTEELRAATRAPGQRVDALAGDVSDPPFCAAAASRFRSLPGDTSVLVNNAGVLGPTGLLEETDWTAWTNTVRVNLFGTALMSRAVLPLLREEGYGKIINLSGGGATAPMPRFSAYAASKAAVVRMTETMAHELTGTRIDVNAIAPGALNTRMLEDVLKAGPEKVGKAYYERSLKQQAEGGAPPEKAAALAVFLASAKSDGITGRLISAVWDDWANLPAQRDALAKSDIYTLRRIVPEDRQGRA